MKIKQILMIFALTVGLCAFLPTSTVAAEECGVDKDDAPYTLKDGEKCCDGMVTQMIECDNTGVNGINQLLLMAINLLTGAVGIAAVGGVIWGSILYTTAAGDPAKTKKGITVITDVVIGLIAFAAMWAVLNFLIPGGVFT